MRTLKMIIFAIELIAIVTVPILITILVFTTKL